MRNYKKLAVVIAIIILTLSLATTGFAANTMKTLQAYYRNITIFRNGNQASFTHEPFIVDGTTYVPVRDMSELLGKTVSFNPQTYRIDITDVADANTVMLQTKVIQQEIEIKNLNTKVKELEAKLAVKEEESKITSVSDLKKSLNKNYGTYSKVDFDIDLSESKTKKTIDVEIFVDLYEDYTAWSKLKTTNIEGYLQDIVDDIRASFKDYTIKGYIHDIDEEVDLYSFTVNKRNQVVLSTKSSGGSSSTSLKTLANDLYDYFKGDYGITDFKLTGSTSDMLVEVYVDYDDWSDLTSTKKTTAVNEIMDFIEDDYPNAWIDGEVLDDWDGDLLRSFNN